MRRGSWISTLAAGGAELPAGAREELARLDDELFAFWNLGGNVLLGWTHTTGGLLFLSVRHHVIPEYVHAGSELSAWTSERRRFINAVLSGSKYLLPEAFQRIRHALPCHVSAVRLGLALDNEHLMELVNAMVRRYSVSLVRNRAVMLLDSAEFSLQSPLDQMAMLNSLAYSVNSAYGQLLSKNIKIDFARTTTGDGFYIWNRSTADGANTELYQLMMMLLADNAVAQRKAMSPWVPRLRGAFHVGEHYEFHQVEGINPTTFSYIVGQVTVDLARMVDGALPGQILLGNFLTQVHEAASGHPLRCDTLAFVENAAATFPPLHGLEIAGGRIVNIRCYLTGARTGSGGFMVNRYYLRDKHGTTRPVYNAKINIHCAGVDPVYLGIRHEALGAFPAVRVEPIARDAAHPGSLLVRR